MRLLTRRWARLLAALVAGAALALTLPPLDVVPAIVAWSAAVGLVVAAETGARKPWLERALVGAAFGFGYHLAGLWWTGVAFLVDLDTFGPFLPLGVVGLPLLLAPFHALAFALVGIAPRGVGWRVVALAVAVSATEALRGVVFTGFPWNVPAVQLSGDLGLVQAAAIVGVDGVGFAAVLVGATPAALVARRWLAALPGIATLAALVLYGNASLAWTDGPAEGRVRIVQPSVPQEVKWDPAHARDIFDRLLALTAMQGPDGPPPPVVVWPETALPFLYREGGVAQGEIARALDGRTLVTGAAVIEADGRATNSMLVLAPDGAVVGRYDKLHLVPFGEYLPFAPLLSRIGLTRLVEGTSQFVAGTARTPLALPGLPPALPLICYEVIFPQDPAGARFVLTVTNDAWFGDTPGPRQHLRLAQLRAIERGLPVIRAANNGISAVIDAAGRIVAQLPLNQQDILDASVPAERVTPFRTWETRPLVFLWISSVALFVVMTKLSSSRSRLRIPRARGPAR